MLFVNCLSRVWFCDCLNGVILKFDFKVMVSLLVLVGLWWMVCVFGFVVVINVGFRCCYVFYVRYVFFKLFVWMLLSWFRNVGGGVFEIESIGMCVVVILCISVVIFGMLKWGLFIVNMMRFVVERLYLVLLMLSVLDMDVL